MLYFLWKKVYCKDKRNNYFQFNFEYLSSPYCLFILESKNNFYTKNSIFISIKASYILINKQSKDIILIFCIHKLLFNILLKVN